MPLPPSSSEVSSSNNALSARVAGLIKSNYQPIEPISDHRCYEADGYFCIDGEIYGHCKDEFCSGGCEKHEKCPCPKHDDETKECSNAG